MMNVIMENNLYWSSAISSKDSILKEHYILRVKSMTVICPVRSTLLENNTLLKNESRWKTPNLTKITLSINCLAFERTTAMISNQNQHVHSLDNHLKSQIFYDKSFLFDVLHWCITISQHYLPQTQMLQKKGKSSNYVKFETTDGRLFWKSQIFTQIWLLDDPIEPHCHFDVIYWRINNIYPNHIEYHMNCLNALTKKAFVPE